MPGYALSTWWWVEFGSVATAIAAIAMDAYRYKANWIAWTLSNCFSAPLFLHGRMWGPFVTLFMYQALNVVGWFVWVREEHHLRNRAAGVATVDDSSPAEHELELSESA
jgi:nicotinamide riboside transporter PnuC